MNQISYNIDVLSQKISALVGALSGRGGDGARVLKTETGQLAGRIGDSLGPKTKEKAFARVDRDIKEHLTIFPTYSNLDEDQAESSTADFTWLEAGPHFLLGINDEDNQLKASGADALQMLRAGQRAGSRGNRYEQLGKRGHQSVQRLNRVRVSQSAFRSVQRDLRGRIGELRASFYRVALYFVPSRASKVPGWIMGKIEQVELKGKSRLDDNGLSSPNPFITFTIRAPGVVSNPSIEAKISGAIKASAKILNSKLQKLLNGYAYQWKTGQVFKGVQEAFEE